MSHDKLLYFIWKIIFGGYSTTSGTCVILLIAIKGICEGTLTTQTCPTTRLLWEKRAENFTCNEEQDIAYHCILDNSGRLIEICLIRKKIPHGKGGCPEVTILDNIPYHSEDNSDCPRENAYCPSANIAYFSDQLYIYPICFLNVSARANYQGETFEKSENTTKWEEKGDEESKYCQDVSSMNLSTVPVLILLAIGFVVSVIIIGIMCFRSRGDKRKGFIRLQKLLCTKKTDH